MDRSAPPLETPPAPGAAPAPDVPRRGRISRVLAWVVAGPPRYLIVIAWAAGAFAATRYLPSLSQSSQSGLSSLTPASAAAVAVERRSVQLFGFPVLSDVALVQYDARGLPADVQRTTVQRAASIDQGTLPVPTGLRGAIPLINAAGALPGAREQGTAAVTYLYFDPSLGLPSQVAAASQFASRYVDKPGQGFVGVTGMYPAWIAQGDQVISKLPLVTIATVVLIALVVGLTFRSIGAPLVTLAAGFLAYLVAQHVVAWVAARIGISAPVELQPLMVVLLLGIVTDYSIFFLSGQRFHIAAGQRGIRAAREATAEYGRVIVTAGLMVAAGVMGLLAARSGYFKAFGPGMALTVVVGLAVSVTLVPALLGILGRYVFWPWGMRPRPHEPAAAQAGAEPRPHSVRARLVRLSTHRAVAVLIAAVCVVGLVLASLGLRQTRLGFSLIGGLPSDSTVKRAATDAQRGFAAGILSPVEMLLQARGITGQKAALVHLETMLAGEPHVAGIVGPREAAAAQTIPSGSGQAAPQSLASAVLAKNGNGARYLLVFDLDPLSRGGLAALEHVQHDMPALLRRAGLNGTAVAYTGDTAIAQEAIHRTLADVPRISAAVLAIDLVLLIVFLRALVAPLYLLFSSILALTATLGLAVFFFQSLLGWDSLIYYVPFAASVLLVSLGSDYNIFLVGSIWEEARLRPIRPAIERAVPRATRAISVAALTLALSFSMLAIVPVSTFAEIAFLLFVGVLLDSFVVRSLLVPALVAIFGHTSAWPSRLQRGAVAEPGQPPRETQEPPAQRRRAA
jgi:putative drug exporter of the RND superfamily